MPCDALVFFFAVVRKLRVCQELLLGLLFSLFPVERLVDFSALWTYPCSEPTGFFFCFEFAERPVEHEANMIAKAAKLLVQILAVPINLRVIEQYLRHHLG